ncbi:50S ribosomal protein L14 [Candidatus Woesearchaeota archaeon]|nr:50S ribosomal protein L14 [Candidatus Woesearchaeota archaeon]
MKAINARTSRSLPHGAILQACDNSGARKLRLISVKNLKTVKGRYSSAGVGDFILCSVVDGKPDMRKKVVPAIIVRTKKEYRRHNGQWIKFEDNAAVVLKDDQGNPKGTLIKGPVAKEACDRWPALPKIAKIIV